jgi:hypothetical protein
MRFASARHQRSLVAHVANSSPAEAIPLLMTPGIVEERIYVLAEHSAALAQRRQAARY